MSRAQSRGPGRKLAVETSPTGYEGVDDAIIKAVVGQVRSLVCANYARIKEFGEDADSKKAAFSLGITINLAATKPGVKTKIRFAQAVTDEAEEIVEDPNQLPLPGVQEGGSR